MKASEIVKNYTGGSLDLEGCDLKGVKLPESVGGELYLGECNLKGVTLPKSVGGGLYTRGCDLEGVTLPSIVEGKPSKMIAFDGVYALFLHEDGLFSAGRQKHLTKEEALVHWCRNDARAIAFTAAINAVI